MQNVLESPAKPAGSTNLLEAPSRSHPTIAQTRPKFKADDGFQAEVRRRVDAYFKKTGKRERDQASMYVKTIAIMIWLVGSWALLVFVAESWWQALPLAVSLAMAMAAIGFSIQHDGGHHAYSRRRWVNRLAAYSLDFLGASSYLWKWKHVIIHHTYPNVTGVDTDVEIGSIVRVTPHQPRKWFHRWQHFYLFALYGLTASRWHLYGDFKEVITGYMGPHKIPRPKGWDLFVFLAGKAWSFTWMLAIPLLYGHPVWLVILFYAIVTGVMGVAMSVVFQLAHCVSEAEFPMPNEKTSRFDHGWAEHQVETTVNFAPRNWPLSWWLGGLNFQIEHHLFPQVCHTHYPAIAPIVEETCQEYGIPYRTKLTFRAGLASHYRWLKKMGQPVNA